VLNVIYTAVFAVRVAGYYVAATNSLSKEIKVEEKTSKT
jgi:hypothetical protein